MKARCLLECVKNFTLLCVTLSPLARAQVTATWTGGAGDWSNAAKWSTGSVPNAATADVIVDGLTGTASQVDFYIPSFGQTMTVGRLWIDAGDSVIFPAYKKLIIVPGAFTGSGSLVNHGSLQMISEFRWGNAASEPVTLSGSGSYVFGNATAGLYLDGEASSPLVNQTTLKGLFGFGTVNSDNPVIQNAGTIEANVSATTSTFAVSANSTSSGFLKASNGATLSFNQGNWDNAGGTIVADGAGSVIQHRAGRITGGTFSTANGGEIWLTDGPAWRNVTNTGNVTLRWPLYGGAPGSLEMTGTLTNSGTMTLNSGAVLKIGRIGGSAETDTLSGGGQVLLKDGSTIDAIDRDNIFYNQDNLISGVGVIGDPGGYAQDLHVRNGGVIQADQAGKVLGIYLITLANEAGGVIRAKDGGIIELFAGAGITNTGGTIEALNSGVVRASSLTRMDGGLVKNIGGVFSLHNFVLANPGTGMNVQGDFTIGNNERTRLVNEISNTGHIRVAGDGSSGVIEIGEDANRTATLTGGGTINMGNTVTGSAASEIRDYEGPNVRMTLTNTDNLILGFGYIGSGARRLALVNRNKIKSDVSTKNLSLELATLDNTGGGLIQAKNGGSLSFGVSRGLENDGGIIETLAGSSATITNSRISGGVFRNDGSSFNLSGVTLDNLTHPLTLDGTFSIPNATSLRIVGNPQSIGKINFNSSGNTNWFYVGEDGAPSVTLPAEGELNFSGDTIATAGTSAAVLINDGKIRGTGTVGYNGKPEFINHDKVEADVAGNLLHIAAVYTTNTGTMRAVSGGKLRLEAGLLENTGGTIRVETGSELTFPSNPRTIKGGTIINEVGGNLLFADGIYATGGIQVQNRGTAELRKGYLDTFSGSLNGGASFINDGLLIVTGGNYQFKAPLAQRGELRSENGNFWLYNGGTIENAKFVNNGGCATVFGGGAGAVYQMSGSNNTFTGAGITWVEPKVEMRFADAQTAATATDFRFYEDGTITGPGTLEVSSRLNFEGGNSTFPVINGTHVIQKAGALGRVSTGQPANIQLTNGAILELGGDFIVNRGTDFTGDATSRLVIPAPGTLEFQDSSDLVIDAPITLRGMLKQNAGTTVKLLKGGIIDGGKFIYMSDGTQFLFGGTEPFIVKTDHCEASGTGVLILDGGATMQFKDAQSRLVSSSDFDFAGESGTTATLSGPGLLSAKVSFVGSRAVIDGATVSNIGLGLLTRSGSNVLFENGARLENSGTFKFDQAPASFVGDNSTLFYNKVGGTVTNDSSVAMDIDMPFKNEGVLDLKKAAFRFLKTFSGRGTIRGSEGAQLELADFVDDQLPRGIESIGTSTLLTMQFLAADNYITLSATNGGGIVASGAGSIIAAGAGNMVAAGGGNITLTGILSMVAAGGGNIVAAGGGNIFAAGGGNIVAAGGGNMVAAGGGNIVAAGGGNRPGRSGKNAGATASGHIVAEAGGTLAGIGTFSGPGFVESGGFLKPGDHLGTLTWTGDLTIESGGTLDIEIEGTTVGTQYDRVNVSGELVIAGRLAVHVLPDFQSTILPTDVFTVATSDSPITGTISNLVNGRIIAADGYSSFAVELTNGGNDLVLTDYQAAPLTFLSWQASQNFLNAGDALHSSDPDHDGLSNLLEYALGRNPLAADGANATPFGSVEVDNLQYFSFSFERPIGSAAPSDITYGAQRSLVLSGDWTSAGVILHEIVPLVSTERVTYRSTTPMTAQGKEFLRLQVILGEDEN